MNSNSKKSIRKKLKVRYELIILAITLLAIYCVIDLTRPLPPPTIKEFSVVNTNSPKLKVVWPNGTEGAIGVWGYGLLNSTTNQFQTPTASIAKLVTALAVLKKYPLSINQTGPIITINQNDVNDYNTFVAEDGSVAKVAVGEQLNEFQALQAMLLPSANNIADTLAIWAFGSISNYVSYANQMVRALGLTNTTISDPSGFSQLTVSTANDIELLGQLSLSNPVINQIVGETSANLPIAGNVKNVNFLLGQDGIIGIKTGNTNQAGGCYLAASVLNTASGKPLIIIVSILKSPDLALALDDTVPILKSVDSQLITKTVPAGTVVENYTSAWGQTANIATSRAITESYLPTMSMSSSIKNNITNFPILANSNIGTEAFGVGKNSQTTNLVSSNSITKPNLWWRLVHPQKLI